ncbi:hypothetical protein [Candidatus Clostridium radicumherbarum]|uniref:Uncharacterized protein n=1 Tax=Candidatus Clostridium radicumherbarum TaxID=3381662 RepID=A0ABW8TX05_9CLOT
MRRIYNMKKTLSMKQFIAEFGDNFSEHLKARLLELGERCVLTRKENNDRFNLKHIEHTTHECAVTSGTETKIMNKEYVYGQLVIHEGVVYFSEGCLESIDAVQAPIVDTIFKALNSEKIEVDEIAAKVIEDGNIDYIIDTICTVCPSVSQAHLDIVNGMTYRSKR